MQLFRFKLAYGVLAICLTLLLCSAADACGRRHRRCAPVQRACYAECHECYATPCPEGYYCWYPSPDGDGRWLRGNDLNCGSDCVCTNSASIPPHVQSDPHPTGFKFAMTC